MFTLNNEAVKEKPITFQEIPKVTSPRVVDLVLAPEDLEVLAMDTPSVGGNNNHYVLRGFNLCNNPALEEARKNSVSFPPVPNRELAVFFHNGALVDGVFNGITIEMLLAVCMDRLEGFQRGAYPSMYNEVAISHIGNALHALDQRTLDVQKQQTLRKPEL